MNNDTSIWLERLTSLHKNQIRKAASNENIQFVHLEILQYLSICNHYSNTAQALCDYLGQTKGSISQSLKFMEDSGYIKRKPCLSDGRMMRLYLTPKSKKVLRRTEKTIFPDIDDAQMLIGIKDIVKNLQNKTHSNGFGQCRTCKFHINYDNGAFQCGLMDQPLSKTDTQKLCKEHVFV